MTGAASFLSPAQRTNRLCASRFATCWVWFLGSSGKLFAPPLRSAELMGTCDSTVKGILLSHMLHEIATGDCPIEGARQRRKK